MFTHLLKSRRGMVMAALVVLGELSLPLWAARAFKISHEGYLRAVPIAVPLQFLAVALLLYTVASSFSRMDRLAARPMRLYQLGSWAALAAPVLAATAAACLWIGDSGNLGTFAPLKALIGLWGIGLLASAVLDRRVACIVPVVGILLPMVISPAAVPGVEYWGFALELDSSPAAWLTALTLLGLGVFVHSRWSDRQRR